MENIYAVGNVSVQWPVGFINIPAVGNNRAVAGIGRLQSGGLAAVRNPGQPNWIIFGVLIRIQCQRNSLLLHAVDATRAVGRALRAGKAGNSMDAKIAMMAMTTKSSIRVKP